jgi:uroporphyrin-III C-methyltransferase / precorrin-2 dehydrogenase / sirohydrochlorin ferrochelatase
MKIYPLSLVIAARSVPVIGQGELAAAKARGVVRAGGVPKLIDPDADLPELERPARIALVADENAERAALWAMRLRAAGFLVNVADQPQLCDFLLPAVIDRAPVMVSLATGGASATLARRLREHFEAQLPASLGPLAEAIAAARGPVAERLPTPAARRAFWDDMLQSGGLLDPFGVQHPPTADAIAAMAQSTSVKPLLSVIALASTEADDLTVRALRRLQAADVVITIGPAAEALSDRARRDARLICHAALPDDWQSALDHEERLAVLLLSTPQQISVPNDWTHEFLSCGKAGL